jgi:peptidoglycan L-alanyl-D-glutamate endopeptidase CwlK
MGLQEIQEKAMINSRNIDDLTPDTAEKCRKFIAACAGQGIDVIITSTYRDIESQNSLYAQGRVTAGNIVTKVKGGDSFHNWRVAFDFVPVVNGKAIWNNDKLWAQCGNIGRQCGLEWGGNWPNFKDMPHMQNTGGLSIAQFKANSGTALA